MKTIGVLFSSGFGLGDFILFLPALRAIRQGFPKANITFLVDWNPLIADMTPLGLCNEIVFANVKQDIGKGLLFVARNRNRHFDLLVNPEFFSRNSVFLQLSSGLLKAGQRVGFAAGPGLQNAFASMYDIKVRFDEQSHRLGNYWRIVEAIGLRARPCEAPAIIVNREAKQWAKRFWESNHLKDPVVGIAPGPTHSSKNWKAWPLNRFKQLSGELEGLGLNVLLLGSAAEEGGCRDIEKSCGTNIVNACGQTKPSQLCALLERCSAVVTNDSGPMHVCSAVGTPVVAIFGPTGEMHTGPLGKNRVVLREPMECAPCYKFAGTWFPTDCKKSFECLEKVKVKDVVGGVQEMLLRRKKGVDCLVGGPSSVQ